MFAISCCTNSAIGQTTERVGVNKLSPQARAEIESQTKTVQAIQQLNQVGELAGMGKEVGGKKNI